MVNIRSVTSGKYIAIARSGEFDHFASLTSCLSSVIVKCSEKALYDGYKSYLARTIAL